jgi:trans-aconitate 2-methyltransferase
MAKSYQWNADEYSRHSGQQEVWAHGLLEQLHLSGDEAVLDIGCGDGKVTAVIAEKLESGRVVGIDSSPDMIRLARDRFENSSCPNVSFMNVDVREMDFSDQFDAAFSNAALHWVKNHRQFLPRVRSALKPGGRILFQMGGKGNAWEILQVLDEMITESRWSPFFKGFEFPYGFHGPDEYRVWLDEAGLEAQRLELIHKDMQHQGAEGLAGWIRSTWLPYIQQVQPDLREAFITEIVDRYIRKHGVDKDGIVHVQMIRLEVEATALP